MSRMASVLVSLSLAFSLISVARADTTFSFTTGAPDGKMATASQPANGFHIDNETADDFFLTSQTSLTTATFTGLLPLGFNLSNIGPVTVEIYHVFPKDSVDPPNGQVPSRANSPSDVELLDRNTGDGTLSFTATTLNPSFTAANSVLNGIFPKPNQTTNGEGPVTGEEVQFDLTFLTPIDLAADRYFFVPQVDLGNGNFFWLSAPFPNGQFAPDLQTWTRNSNLDPNWLRVGTDIVGSTDKFNGSFSVTGTVIPEPSTLILLGTALVGLALLTRKRAKLT